MSKNLFYLGIILGTTLSCSSFCAETTKKEAIDDTRAYFEVLRSEFNADKVATINQIMKLNETESPKFWPIYREYEKELAGVGDRKLELIREFFKYHTRGSLTNEKSKDIATRWLENLQERTDLWKKYHKRISDDLSPIRAAQFLQIENQIALFIDLSIASEMPAIVPVGQSR